MTSYVKKDGLLDYCIFIVVQTPRIPFSFLPEKCVVLSELRMSVFCTEWLNLLTFLEHAEGNSNSTPTWSVKFFTLGHSVFLHFLKPAAHFLCEQTRFSGFSHLRKISNLLVFGYNFSIVSWREEPCDEVGFRECTLWRVCTYVLQ